MKEKLIAPYRLVILNPGKQRRAFKIELRRNTGRIEQKRDSRLDGINRAFQSGKLDFEGARKQVEELRHNLYREDKGIRAVVHNSDNALIKAQYWKQEYSHRTLVDPKTAEYEIDRAVEALGTLSLRTATQEELQAALGKFRGNKQRRLVASLYRLLRFIGRVDVRLRKDGKEKKRVRSLSEKEFLRVLLRVEDEHVKILMGVAYYTGARVGECFAMTSEDFVERKNYIKIYSQIDKKGVSRDTKNRRDRITIVPKRGVKFIKEWLQIKNDFDGPTRGHLAEIVKAACCAEFPKDPLKHLVFHDLRHCYARYCRERGMSTSDIAELIGDSEAVAKEHYIGFHPSDEVLEMRRKKLLKR